MRRKAMNRIGSLSAYTDRTVIAETLDQSRVAGRRCPGYFDTRYRALNKPTEAVRRVMNADLVPD